MKAEIVEYLEDTLPKGLFVVNVSLSQNNNKINVFLDGDYGITVDECGKVSRQLKEKLDNEPDVPAEYTLNVSSAGVNEPLKTLRQFKKNVNRSLKIRTYQTEKNGKLVYVDKQRLVVKLGKDEFLKFEMDSIIEAKVTV